MLFIIIITPKCNLKCRYCGGNLPGMPDDIQYDINDLVNLIGKYPESVVAFYGGEPLLKHNIVREMIAILPAKYFVLNTNGYFLGRIEDIINDFDTILLSIDGREEVTDDYRQIGCYKNVMDALNFLKSKKFKGEIIGRMTASAKTDIYKEVVHLLDFFPFVHWQIDAIWSSIWDLKDFKKWIEISYKPNILKLIDFWIDGIKHDRIIGIVPFLGIMSRLLYGGNGLPCESGNKSFTVTTDGKIMACPIAPDYEWNVLGDLNKFKKIRVNEPCVSCDIYNICGGRCLFTYKERLWGEEGFLELCNLTKFLVNELRKYENLCNKSKEKFFYRPYNNTTEIIP